MCPLPSSKENKWIKTISNVQCECCPWSYWTSQAIAEIFPLVPYSWIPNKASSVYLFWVVNCVCLSWGKRSHGSFTWWQKTQLCCRSDGWESCRPVVSPFQHLFPWSWTEPYVPWTRMCHLCTTKQLWEAYRTVLIVLDRDSITMVVHVLYLWIFVCFMCYVQDCFWKWFGNTSQLKTCLLTRTLETKHTTIEV